MAGNKAAARALSLSANQLNNQVSELHHQAASKIFQERNQNLSEGEPVCDLHGLHPLEAIEMLDETIKKLTQRRYKGRVLIVTGTGHHSRGKSKVFPAVKSHLQASGWRPTDATLNDGKGGLLIIKI